MGFLKFLKGKKEEFKFPSKDELDIPPAPVETQEAEKPVFPSLDEYDNKADKYSRADRMERMEERIEEKELDEPTVADKPIFVRSDFFKAMIDELTVVKTTLKESDHILARVAEFKADEDKEFDKWHLQLKDVHKKLIYAEGKLFA